MAHVRSSLALMMLILTTVGCASTTVKKDPGPHDCGIRFYRPKPYLLIAPYEENKEVVDQGKTIARILSPTDRYVSMKLEYLPDFSEEYSIHIKAGIGTNDTEVTLTNGWNLTQLNSKIDSKANENIEAVSKLIEAVPKGVSTLTNADQKKDNQDGRGNPLVVAASNVPLGYYEAVLSPGPDGKKRLYGWRYVGFMPYQACPAEGAGLECKPCDANDIYGLGFENGVMTFRNLSTMRHQSAKLQVQQPPANLSIRALVYDILSDKGMAVDKVAVTITKAGTRTIIDIYQLNAAETRSLSEIIGEDEIVFKEKLEKLIQSELGLELTPTIKYIPAPKKQ